MSKLNLLSICAAMAVALMASAVPANNAAVVGLSPEPDQARTARLITGLLSESNFHYKPTRLDDALSAKMFDAYLESLDGERLFFLRGDIDRFSVYRTHLDDALKAQQLDPAFEIFNVYVQRVVERTAHARALLKQDFDFTVEEEYRYDRDELQWEPSAEALEEVWRRRVKNDVLRLKLAGKQMREIRNTLDKRYANFESRVHEIKSEDVFQTFINAYAGSIEPHTSYMTPRTSENFNISMRLSLEGIGAVLQRQDEFTVVRSIVPGGPAGMSGQLEVGDRILGVGQGTSGPVTDVIGWRIDDVVELIRGPKDTTVRIEILPGEVGIDGPHEVVSLVRDRVKLEEQAAQKEIIEIGEGESARRIGVIALPAFYQDFDARRRDEADYRSATRDVGRLLTELEAGKVDGVVLDLRDNGGGSLSEAIELTGLFIDQGPVVQVRTSSGAVKVEKDSDAGVAWRGPLAVLVNRASASASEIFAAAMQDYGRALIIGEPTFGKGTVQNLIDLDNFVGRDAPPHGALKLTVAQFFRIDGGSTQHRGVVPDIQFPVTIDAQDYGESAYDNALPWSQIEPAHYSAVGRLAPLTALLSTRHRGRVADDVEFQWWAEDVAEYRRQRAQTTVSLNEAERVAERKREERQREQRKTQRAALGIGGELAALDPDDDGLQADERAVVEQAQREQAQDERPDALLREASAILADAIGLLDQDKSLANSTYPAGLGIHHSN
ncbi:MAG TPA: carboxy terminal-processing peptidase [Xanthomonadaceae bacterium]|nr:carboxy terminal-processing peptidase [Xanthomonadaceae bacterium]